jgi:hypothetical protein
MRKGVSKKIDYWLVGWDYTFFRIIVMVAYSMPLAVNIAVSQ